MMLWRNILTILANLIFTECASAAMMVLFCFLEEIREGGIEEAETEEEKEKIRNRRTLGDIFHLTPLGFSILFGLAVFILSFFFPFLLPFPFGK